MVTPIRVFQLGDSLLELIQGAARGQKSKMATVQTTPFELVGADGGPLRGDVRTAGAGDHRPAVLVCHGFKGFKDWGFLPHLAHRVANAGLTAISFNFSGSGIGPDGESYTEPERFGHATHSGDLRDIEIVLDTLLSGELSGLGVPSALGLVGHSRGGGAAVLTAGARSDISSLVTLAAIGRVDRWPDDVLETWRRDGKIDIVNARTGDVLPLFTDLLDEVDEHAAGRLDILAAAQRVTAPWLIVHGDEDETVPVGDARELMDAHQGDGARLEVIPGGSHTFGVRHPWSGSTGALRQAVDSTIAWLTRHML